ncbi:hypothetical protein ACJW30_12G071600 [Castanea mollissima]
MILLILNCVLLSLGNCGGPLIMRLYFTHGPNRVWLSSWLETGGWPIIFFPLIIAYFRRRDKQGGSTKLFSMKPTLLIASAVIGVLTGLDDYLYAYGVKRLPVSTSSLIIATQLAFTAIFAFLLVSVLALHTSSDRPTGESKSVYFAGFFMTLGASALYGFVLPLIKLSYKKAKQEITYSLVMEFQIVMCFFATLFCTVGMLINKDFKAIPREAMEFGLGETRYYTILVFSTIFWQAFFLGAIGVIFCASSLLSGIIITVLLPVIEVLAFFFYKESFTTEKGVSLALCSWGFVSYFYGGITHSKKARRQIPDQEAEMPQILNP